MAPRQVPANAGSQEPLAIASGGRTVMRHGGPDNIRADAPQLADVWQARGMNSAIRTPLITTGGLFGHLIVTRRCPIPTPTRRSACSKPSPIKL